VLRSGVGGVERALAANPAYHLAAHHAAFSTTASCKLQLILRRCGGGVVGLALHLSLTFSKLFDANPASHIAAHHANFSAAFSASAFCRVQLILRSCLSSQG